MLRIGAVNYLNSKPLVEGLDRLGQDVRLTYDLPSRLADSLAAKRLDVALIPSVEFLRSTSYAVVSDACVACCGPVLSVKLHFRVAPSSVRRIALDEGSRTSAALALVLLESLAGALPQCESLPIGAGLEDSDADAVLLIGDRAIQLEGSPSSEIWDLGERWTSWTGLPFVFAMWVARLGTEAADLSELLSAARDRGVRDLAAIAEREADILAIDRHVAERYLRKNLHFWLGQQELNGLARFAALCAERGLAPEHARRPFERILINDCTVQK